MNFIRSPLKFPGSKYKVLQHIIPILPKSKRFVEPFVGSGTVFLNTNYEEYLLCDNSSDIINFFTWLVKEKDGFIARCKEYFNEDTNLMDKFYDLRNEFNSLKENDELRAVLFLYLTRHSYNGLIRFNKSGLYNSPFGTYTDVYFPYNEMLNVILKSNKCKLEFKLQDAHNTFLFDILNGDTIYCDPPYCKLSKTAKFGAYSKDIFTITDHVNLVEHVTRTKKQFPNNTILISNHDIPATRYLYNDAIIVPFDVRRTISCKKESRIHIPELLAIY